jgi:hypothetical protein
MMTWTHEPPTKPGLYWYRDTHETIADDYQTANACWNNNKQALTINWLGSDFHSSESNEGEWYGPLTPPSHHADQWNSADGKRNTRVIVRLRHGGSFYIENSISDETARLLSDKLKQIRQSGSTIPADLRAKISGVFMELIKFAGSSQAYKQETSR